MNPKRILLVEDEQIIQVLCKRLLGQIGHSLTMMDGVQQAIGLVKSQPFDLLITDLRLPDGDGVDVIAALRESQPACKIIVITGSPTPEDRFRRVKGLEADYINKPFEVEVLMSAVNKALGE
jgi:DNA-binding NtrC family response regulator